MTIKYLARDNIIVDTDFQKINDIVFLILSTITISITDVDGDETWDDGDTGLVITGIGFM